jgi:hypothetical protein
MAYGSSGIKMRFTRPTDHYDEKVTKIDEQICDLVKQRKEISSNDPGYPPFEYITGWAEKYGLYEDLLKSIFSTLWQENIYKPTVEPEGFQKIVPVLKTIEVENKLYTVIAMRQYMNASIIIFNIEWDSTSDSLEDQSMHMHYELFINADYDCRVIDGSGSSGHSHNNFLVFPRLPDDLSGIELTLKQYRFTSQGQQADRDIILCL